LITYAPASRLRLARWQAWRDGDQAEEQRQGAILFAESFARDDKNYAYSG
jgi:hypothetical protein